MFNRGQPLIPRQMQGTHTLLLHQLRTIASPAWFLKNLLSSSSNTKKGTGCGLSHEPVNIFGGDGGELNSSVIRRQSSECIIYQQKRLFVGSSSENRHASGLDLTQLLHELLDGVVCIGQIAQELIYILDGDASIHKSLTLRGKEGSNHVGKASVGRAWCLNSDIQGLDCLLHFLTEWVPFFCSYDQKVAKR